MSSKKTVWNRCRLHNLAGPGDGKKRAAPDQPVVQYRVRIIHGDKKWQLIMNLNP